MSPARWAAVVTAAGTSRRMGGTTKKEFLILDGAPVLARAIRPFLDAGAERIVVTLPADRLSEGERLLEPHLDLERLAFVAGGASRQESVRRGLVALTAEAPEIVLIHDGARPWLAGELVARVLAATERSGACVPALEAHEAVKQAGAGGYVLQHFRRHTIRLAQTPQGFSYPRILEAHERARRAGLSFVDDAEVYDRFEGPVAWVEGDPANRKITFSEDVEGRL